MSQTTNSNLPDPTDAEILAKAKERALEMQEGSRRVAIPVRARFIRDITTKSGETADTPMKRLVRYGDRDGITIRLYLALLWRCSAPPFNTEISAVQWAELLGLAPPIGTYSRRVAKAIKRLEDQNLIFVERSRGKTSVITLLDESGSGEAYQPPRESGRSNRWVKIPVKIWQEDAFHDLTTPGLAMMLAILAEREKERTPMWWSQNRFQQTIGLTPSTRARGVAQLKKAGFLKVIKEKVPNAPKRFSREAVRSTYLLSLDGPAAFSKKS